MQVNNAKQILSGVHTGTRTQLQQVPEHVSQQNIDQATHDLALLFRGELKDLTSIAEVFQLEQAFLLAVKTVQEDLNHGGAPSFDNGAHYSAKDGKYAQLDEKGLAFLSQLLESKSTNLENLKKVCFHKNAIFGDRKYSLFGTSYSLAAEDLRNCIRPDAYKKTNDLQAAHKYAIEDSLNIIDRELTGQFLINRLLHADTPVAIQKFLRSNGETVRVGKVQIEKEAEGKVKVTILDDNRSYLVNDTYGATKLVKAKNFNLVLTEGELKLLEHGYIEDYGDNIEQFASLSRPDTSGVGKSKTIQRHEISGVKTLELKDKVRAAKNTPEDLLADGFVERKILDKNGRIKTIYVAPYKGVDLLKYSKTNGFHFQTKQQCAAFIDIFAESIFTANEAKPLYDVKLKNTLVDNKGGLHVIDSSRKMYTEGYALEKTLNDLQAERDVLIAQPEYTRHTAFATAMEHHQPQLLRDALFLSMLRICALATPVFTFKEALAYIISCEAMQNLGGGGGEEGELLKYVHSNADVFRQVFKSLRA